MSAAVTEPPASLAENSPRGIDWSLVLRQITGIMRLELRRNLFSRRAFALYFLAFSPLPFFMLWAIMARREITYHEFDIEGPAQAVAGPFTFTFVLYVGSMLFLSALITFMSPYRTEILERSLHYYYLTPVRRWVLVVGKYCSALIASCTVFAVATAALFFLTCIPWGFGEMNRYLFSGPGLGNLVAYLGIAVLGCVGYGAVFLLVGLFFRNAIAPAALIWGWEAINFLLPPLLQKISVIHYLKALFPIPPSETFVAVITNPTSPWISVPGLLIFTALVLAFAGWRARHMEISYGGE